MSETNGVTGLNVDTVPPSVIGVSYSSSPPNIETYLLIVGTGQPVAPYQLSWLHMVSIFKK
jgi:hypothetical protein